MTCFGAQCPLSQVMSMFENRLATRGNMVLVYWSTILQSVLSILVVNHSLVEASGSLRQPQAAKPGFAHPQPASSVIGPRRARCFTLAAWDSSGVGPIGLRPMRWWIKQMRCNTCTLDHLGPPNHVLLYKAVAVAFSTTCFISVLYRHE